MNQVANLSTARFTADAQKLKSLHGKSPKHANHFSPDTEEKAKKEIQDRYGISA